MSKLLKLTLPQQRAILRELPNCKKLACRRICRNEMAGKGLRDKINLKGIFAKVRKALGPVAKVIGPVVLKEFLLPYLKKKAGMEGTGKRRKKRK